MRERLAVRGARAPRIIVFGVVGALGMAFGCSSSSPSQTLSEFCSQVAQIECTGGQNGGGGGVEGLCVIADDTCENARLENCENAAAAATSDGLRNFNPGNAGGCLGALTNLYQGLGVRSTTLDWSQVNEDVSPNPQGTTEYLCDDVFTGDQGPGDRCVSDFDCADGNICTPINGGSKVFQCAQPVMLGPNAECSNAGSRCPPTYECQGSENTAYTCVSVGAMGKQGGTGAMCKTDADCSSDAPYCDTFNAPPECDDGPSLGRGNKDCTPYQKAVTSPAQTF